MATGFKLAEAFIQITADHSKLTSGLASAKNQVTRELGHIQAAASNAMAAMGRIGGVNVTSLSALGAALGPVGVAMAAIGVAAGGAAAKGLALASAYEDAHVAIKVMLGSGAQATKLLKDLEAFGAATPFSFSELIPTAQSLAAQGFEVEQILPLVKMFGDVAAGTGRPLSQFLFVLGQVKAAGRLFTQDMYQFQNAGIPMIKELSKVLGVSESKVKDFVSKGNVGFNDVLQVFKNMTAEGGIYFGMMEERSQTMSGLWSTVKDNMEGAMRDVGKSIQKNLDIKQIEKDMAGLAKVFQKEWAPVLAEVAGALGDIFKTNPSDKNKAGGGGFSLLLADTGRAMKEAGLIFTAGWAHILGFDQYVDDVSRTLQQHRKLYGTMGGDEGPPKIDQPDIDEEEAQAAAAAEALAEMSAEIGDVIIKLEEQYRTAGMTADALALYKLEAKGASGADLERIEHLQRLNRLKQEYLDNTEAILKVDKLWSAELFAGNSGLKGRDLEIAKLRESMGSFEMAMARGQEHEWNKSKAALDALIEKDKALDKLDRKSIGDKLVEEMKTPVERYADRINEIHALWKEGAIDPETHNRAMKQAQDELSRESAPTAGFMGIADFHKKMQLSAASGGKDKNLDAIEKGNKLADEQLKEARKTRELLERSGPLIVME
jgi:hypothetical protein